MCPQKRPCVHFPIERTTHGLKGHVKVLQTSLECLALLVSTCNSLEPLGNPRIRYKRKQGYPSDYSPQKSPQSLDAAPSPVLVSRQRKAACPQSRQYGKVVHLRVGDRIHLRFVNARALGSYRFSGLICWLYSGDPVTQVPHRFCCAAIHRRARFGLDRAKQFQTAKLTEVSQLQLWIGNKLKQAGSELAWTVEEVDKAAVVEFP
jgi:hypothetical protein